MKNNKIQPAVISMNLILLSMSIAVFFSSCSKVIDVSPQSNLYGEAFYQNAQELNVALAGCYNGMQKPLLDEWKMTELRSDNAVMGFPTSGSAENKEFTELDIFMPITSNTNIYDYWLNSYYNIANTNRVLKGAGLHYHPDLGTHSFDSITIPVSLNERYQISAEASFIRAYHYFNLVRLYGGVFLIDHPITLAESKTINRSTTAEIYKLIVADLQNTIDHGDTRPFSQIAPENLGRANAWCAKALLAKVYLTLNQKTEASVLLHDIIANSGYSLQSTYAAVFSITNEMNSEMMFAVRYKSGTVGLGSPFANLFAPSASGMAVVNGDGDSYDYPSVEIISAYNSADVRKTFNIGRYLTKDYVNKYISSMLVANDAENDWPVIRYADVLLMLAEADGKTTETVGYLNQIHQRAGLSAFTSSATATVAAFEKTLSTERRLEFAFENQRWFDIVRFNTTLTTLTAEQIMKDHFTYMYTRYYDSYPPPAYTLLQLQSFVTAEHLLLPIPQREIDNNTNIVIQQNPGY